MKKQTAIVLSVMMITLSSLFVEGMEVHDSAAIAGILQNGSTAVKQLNTTTEELGTLDSTYALATQNSQTLQANNWNDVSGLITKTNAVASIPQSMTWATTSAISTFMQLFPGDNKTMQYLNDVTQRSTGAINTFKGSLSAVQSLGNAINDYKSTLSGLAQAQSAVQGHLSAAEQSNQIQGNILNTLQATQMAEMSAASSANTFYAYQVQQKQIEIESNQRFLSGTGNIDPTYKNQGTGDIPSL